MRTVEKKPLDGCSSVFTFDYPPEQFFRNDIRLLSNFAQRRHLIQECGIDEVVSVDFGVQFAQIDPIDFVEDILVHTLSAKHIVCGFNFRFGHQGKGSPQLLKELGEKLSFSVDVVPPYDIEGGVVSSTRIRSLIQDGNIEMAAKLLGRYPSYIGVVVPGFSRGRQLGFPTANLQIPSELVIPGQGVYLTWCVLEGGTGLLSVTAVGNNPTFDGDHQTIETHLLDFCQDLYGKTVELQFLWRMRDICRYESVEQLKTQIDQDVQQARSRMTGFHLQGNRVVIK